jgi:hypothetical protein
MEKINKFFYFDEDEGKMVLNPPFMGSDSWNLRSESGQLLVSIEDFLDVGEVFLEDGFYNLALLELDDYHCFVIKFGVKGRQVIVEEVVCRNSYKRHLQSIMPDRGMYIL